MKELGDGIIDEISIGIINGDEIYDRNWKIKVDF